MFGLVLYELLCKRVAQPNNFTQEHFNVLKQEYSEVTLPIL
jgi:hypothetical protein